MYQIVFDDRSAPTTITEIIFSQARQSYLALPANEQQTGVHLEPPPRQKPPQNRRKNNRDQQQPTTTTSDVEIPVEISASNTNNTMAIIPAVPAATNSTTVPLITSTNNQLCSIQECPEYCEPDTFSACTECPESERNYIYCHLHNKHISHANQSAPRRTFNSTVPLPSSRSNNDNIASNSIVVHTVNNDDSIRTNIPATNSTTTTTTTTVVLNARGGPARKKKRLNPDSEEFCWCGCTMRYDNSCMSKCKGVDCDKLVNRTCVPNTWLCGSCKPLDSSKS